MKRWNGLFVPAVLALLALGGCERFFGPDLSELAPFGDERVAEVREWVGDDREALLAFMAEPGVTVDEDGFAWRFAVRQENPSRRYDPTMRVLTTHRVEVPGIGVVYDADPRYGPTPVLPPEVMGPIWAEVLPFMHEAERVRVAVPPWVAERGVGGEEAPDGRLYFLEITVFSITPY